MWWLLLAFLIYIDVKTGINPIAFIGGLFSIGMIFYLIYFMVTEEPLLLCLIVFIAAIGRGVYCYFDEYSFSSYKKAKGYYLKMKFPQHAKRKTHEIKCKISEDYNHIIIQIKNKSEDQIHVDWDKIKLDGKSLKCDDFNIIDSNILPRTAIEKNLSLKNQKKYTYLFSLKTAHEYEHFIRFSKDTELPIKKYSFIMTKRRK